MVFCTIQHEVTHGFLGWGCCGVVIWWGKAVELPNLGWGWCHYIDIVECSAVARSSLVQVHWLALAHILTPFGVLVYLHRDTIYFLLACPVSVKPNMEPFLTVTSFLPGGKVCRSLHLFVYPCIWINVNVVLTSLSKSIMD